eukprot:UN04022
MTSILQHLTTNSTIINEQLKQQDNLLDTMDNHMDTQDYLMNNIFEKMDLVLNKNVNYRYGIIIIQILIIFILALLIMS